MNAVCAHCKVMFQEGGTFCNTPKGLVHPECADAASVMSSQVEAMKAIIPLLSEQWRKDSEPPEQTPEQKRIAALKAKLNVCCWMVQSYSLAVKAISGEGEFALDVHMSLQEEISLMMSIRAELLALEKP